MEGRWERMAGERKERRGLTPAEILLALAPASAAILLLDPFAVPSPYFLTLLGGWAWALVYVGPPSRGVAIALLPALGGSAGYALAAWAGGVDPLRAFLEMAAKALPLCALWAWTFPVLTLHRLAAWIQARTRLRLLPQLLVTIQRMLTLLWEEARSKRRALLSRAPRLRRGARVRTLLHLSAALAGSTARRALASGRAMEARGYRGVLPLSPPPASPPALAHLLAGSFFLLLLMGGLCW